MSGGQRQRVALGRYSRRRESGLDDRFGTGSRRATKVAPYLASVAALLPVLYAARAR
jgi:hypothetical protein